MYQVTPRETGRCFLCPETDVTTATKDGTSIPLCRRHLWMSLAGNGEPKKKMRKKKHQEQPEEAAVKV